MYNIRNMSVNDPYNPAPINIYISLTKLWLQYVFWMRSFVISAKHDLPDLQFVTKRLLTIPSDFARFLEPFYGENSKEFERLLRDHLLLGTNFINDLKRGDTYAANVDRVNWYMNAEELADFLTRANQLWTLQRWQEILYQLLRSVENYARSRFNDKYEEDIVLFDSMEEQVLKIADLMSQGSIFSITRMPFRR